MSEEFSGNLHVNLNETEKVQVILNILVKQLNKRAVGNLHNDKQNWFIFWTRFYIIFIIVHDCEAYSFVIRK